MASEFKFESRFEFKFESNEEEEEEEERAVRWTANSRGSLTLRRSRLMLPGLRVKGCPCRRATLSGLGLGLAGRRGDEILVMVLFCLGSKTSHSFYYYYYYYYYHHYY